MRAPQCDQGHQMTVPSDQFDLPHQCCSNDDRSDKRPVAQFRVNGRSLYATRKRRVTAPIAPETMQIAPDARRR